MLNKYKYKMVKIPKKFERWVNRELHAVKSNLVLKNSDTDYEVYGLFRILCEPNSVKVYSKNDQLAAFSSKKTAVAWCTATKFRLHDLAYKIQQTDQRLQTLNSDIRTRLYIAAHSKHKQFCNTLLCKIETKIIRQKQLEKQLRDCANLAKYYQQRGFDNETARAR